MARYIDLDRQLARLHLLNLTCEDVIKEFLLSADAVEVVRCKDCIHCDCSIDGMGFFYCDFDEGRTVSPNGFCDVAERRKETEDA